MKTTLTIFTILMLFVTGCSAQNETKQTLSRWMNSECSLCVNDETLFSDSIIYADCNTGEIQGCYSNNTEYDISFGDAMLYKRSYQENGEWHSSFWRITYQMKEPTENMLYFAVESNEGVMATFELRCGSTLVWKLYNEKKECISAEIYKQK